ncbi:OmpA family protein [Actibacterium sp. D379-3]
MLKRFINVLRTGIGGILALALALALTGAAAQAEQKVIKGERYIPTVWVDPDGCEHWVMDDGLEGYMTPHVTRDGIPVCRRGNTCGVIASDQLFATDKSYISPAGVARLQGFFKGAKASAFVIAGHTDSRASDAYNMGLSQRRANAVAKVARSTGANVIDVRAYGERVPVATNGTAAGMAKNRRVEIICIR